MGDRSFIARAPGAPAVDETQEVAPDSRLRALAQRRVLQRKAQREAPAEVAVSQPGDAAEKEADAVADAVVDGGETPKVQAKPEEGVARKPTDKHDLDGRRGSWAAANGAAPEEFTAQTEGEAEDVVMAEAPDAVMDVIMSEMMGSPVDEKLRDAALKALDKMSPQDFSTMLRELQRAGLMDEFMKGLGELKGEKMVGELQSEFFVPAVAFGPVSEGKVDEQFKLANQILNQYGIQVHQAGFKRVGSTKKEKKAHKDTKSMLGNKEGTIDEDELEKDGGIADQVIEEFSQPGKIGSFWFSDIIEDDEKKAKGETLLGHAMTEHFKEKHRGKEAVFIDANGAHSNVLAHELGHILGGDAETGDHVQGADGKEESGDPENVMFKYSKDDKLQDQLTPEQVAAFKTSIYAKITRMNVVNDAPIDDGKDEKRSRTA